MRAVCGDQPFSSLQDVMVAVMRLDMSPAGASHRTEGGWLLGVVVLWSGSKWVPAEGSLIFYSHSSDLGHICGERQQMCRCPGQRSQCLHVTPEWEAGVIYSGGRLEGRACWCLWQEGGGSHCGRAMFEMLAGPPCGHIVQAGPGMSVPLEGLRPKVCIWDLAPGAG